MKLAQLITITNVVSEALLKLSAYENENEERGARAERRYLSSDGTRRERI